MNVKNKIKKSSPINPLRKSPVEGTGWIVRDEPCAHESIHYIASSLAGMGASFHNSIMSEGGIRLNLATRIASMLEDSLFYARMYQDQCPDGRARREDMIDDATSMIREFRTGKP